MGGQVSSLLSQKKEDDKNDQPTLSAAEIDAAKVWSGFSEGEVAALYSRFQSLGPNDSKISVSNLLKLPELNNPFQQRMPYALALDPQNSTLTFREFLRVLSVFNPKTSVEDKLDFLFRVYDWDADGRISKEDMRQALGVLPMGSGLIPKAHIKAAVDAMFAELGLGGGEDWAEDSTDEEEEKGKTDAAASRKKNDRRGSNASAVSRVSGMTAISVRKGGGSKKRLKQLAAAAAAAEQGAAAANGATATEGLTMDQFAQALVGLDVAKVVTVYFAENMGS